MKKPIKISITILLAFTMVFTNLFSSVPEGLIKDLFGNTATEVQAASKDDEKHATGHKLHSNTDMGKTAVEILGHSSSTPFRKFYMHDDGLDANKRVICGYSEGRGHPGDKYKKTIVLAKNWKNAKNDNALWGHNTKKVAKALKWFFHDVGPGNASAKQAYFIQTYVWAKTMGRNSDTALEQLARSKNWKLSDLHKMEDQVEAQTIDGWIAIYEKTGACVAGDTKNVHQPYFRWFSVSPEQGSVTSSKQKTIKRSIPIVVNKVDSSTGNKTAVNGVEVKATLAGKNYYGVTGQNGGRLSDGNTNVNTTNEQGKIKFSTSRQFIGEGKGSAKYIENWDELTKEQQNDYKSKGYWSSKALAKSDADKQAEDNAKKAAKAKLDKLKETWTFTEIKAPGYFYKVGNKPKSITKTVNKGTTEINITFDNHPKYGKIELQKVVAEENGKELPYSKSFSLENAVYTVKKGSSYDRGEVVGTITISKVTKDGKTIYAGSLGNLTIGKYFVKETKAPNGFNVDDVTASGKTHSFELVDNGGDTLVTKVLSSSKIDDFTIKSVEKPKTGTVSLKKWLKTLATGKGSEETIVGESGIKFTLKAVNGINGDSDYATGVTAETNSNGEITWSKVPYGTYTITMDKDQTLAKNITFIGPITVYVQDDATDKYHGNNIQLGYGVDATGKPTDSLTVDEETPAGTVVVHKSKSSISKDGAKEYHPEKGAWFQILDEDSTPISDFKTDTNGFARSSPIGQAGTYYLHQVRGSDKKHALMEDQMFVVTEDNLDIKKDFKVFEFNVINEYVGDHIHISKKKLPYDDSISSYVEDQKTPEEGAVFTVLDVARMGDTALKQLMDNGRNWNSDKRQEFVISVGDAALATLTTNENGEADVDLEATLNGDNEPVYKIGEKGYVLLQTKGTDGYELSNPLRSPEKLPKPLEGEGEAKTSENGISESTNGYYFTWSANLTNRQKHPMAIAKFTKLKTTIDDEGQTSTEPEVGAKFKVIKADGTYLKYQDDNGVSKDVECTANNSGVVYVPYLSRGVYSLEQISGSGVHQKITFDMDEGTFAVNQEDLFYSGNQIEALAKNNYDGIDNNHVVTIASENNGEITDEELPVSVKLLKTSSDTGVPLAKAEFTLYKKIDGEYNEVDQYYTDENGELTIQDLQFGKYKIRETKAPDGYLATETDTGKETGDEDFPWQEVEFIIDENHVVDNGGVLYFTNKKADGATTFTFKDSPIFGKIAVNKSGTVMTGFSENDGGFNYAKQNLAGAKYGLYAKEDIMDDSGKLIWAKDTLIDEKTTTGTDAVWFTNDVLTPSDNFYMGSYYVKELEAPAGFDIDETKHDVNLTWQAGAKDSEIGAWEPDDDAEFSEQGSKGKNFLAQGSKLNPYIVNAKKVVFTYEKAPEGVDVWDVSADGISDDVNSPNDATNSSTVVLWHDPEDSNTIYISSQKAEQEIKFNKLSSEMFYKCANLTSVIFFNVDTSYIVNADKMFAYCTSLTKLDLSNWDTHRLNSTVQMFANSSVLEKVYVGNTDMHYEDEAEAAISSIYVTPKYNGYLYYDPATDQTTLKELEAEITTKEEALKDTSLSEDEKTKLEEEKTLLEENKASVEATLTSNRFSIDSFSYSLMYDNGNAQQLSTTDGVGVLNDFTISNGDIESFSPEYPNFGDQSNRSGELKVTIKLKESSEYYKYTDKDGNGNPTGLLTVTVNVLDPNDLKFNVDEHPSATVEAEDESWGMYLSVLKADSGEAVTQADDSETADPTVMNDLETGLGKAEFTVYAATDLKSYNTDENGNPITVIKAGTKIKTIQSIAKDEDDGGRAGTDLLPFDYYAADKNAENLYRIIETKAPDGYAIDSAEAYVPNINYRGLSADDILAKLQKTNGDKIKVKYSAEDKSFAIAFTFFDTKAPTITKDWGRENTNEFVEESKRPDHLTIRMYKDRAKTQLYKEITLTKDGHWSYTFDEDVDLSKFYYEEDTSNFPENVKIDKSDYKDGYYVDKKNNAVKFYNIWDKPDDPPVVLSIHKTWKDNDNASGKRPREIKVTLYQNGVPIKIPGQPDIILNESNNWTYEMPEDEALPQYDDFGVKNVYRWEEDSDSLGEDYELVSQETTTTESTQYIYMTTELVNAYSKYTTASVRKSWDDEKNLYGQRPKDIKVHLLADGKQVDKFTLEVANADGTVSNKDVTNGEVTLNEKNAWSAKAINLDKYKGKDKIQYTWEEVDVGDGYKLAANTTTLENEDEANETFITNLTNKYTPAYGSVKVSKVIPVSSLDFRHGDITFKFDLTGETIHGTQAKDSKSVTFSQDTLSDKGSVVTIDGKQYLKLSVTFNNLDWGDYRVTESGSESRYQFDSIDGLKNATIGKDAKGNSYISFTVNKDLHEFTGTFHNRTIPASVKIVKYGKSGIKKLKGVTFKIEKITGDSRELIKSATTGDEGEILFDDLAPGDYEITETKTLKGYTLLKEPIKVTLPLTMTKERAEQLKADTSKAVYDSEKKLYYFYSVSYKVDNDAGFEVPHTGFKDNLKTYLPLIAAMIMIVGTEIWVCIGRKRPKKRA